MEILINQILAHKEAAALPQLLESGELPALISGLAPVHRANLAAALKSRLEMPLFVICPDDTAAESFAMDLRAMLDKEVSTLLMRDFYFHTTEAVSRGAEQKRISTLYKLARGESDITVASVSGMMQRSMSPGILLHAAYEIEDGGNHPPEEVEQALINCGYSRTEQVEGPGQFARRGGILDFYSPSEPNPVRCEFFGDEIDSMGYFDISSQRRTETLRSVQVLPAFEALPSLYSGGSQGFAAELERLLRKAARRKTRLPELEENIAGDIERLRNDRTLIAADRYLSML